MHKVVVYFLLWRLSQSFTATTTESQNPHPPSNHSFLVNFITAFGTLTVRRTNRANEIHVASTVLHRAPRPETLVPVANGPIANEAVAYTWDLPAVRDAGAVLALAALQDAEVNMRRAKQPRERAASADGCEERWRLVVNDFKDGFAIKVRCVDRHALGFAVLAQREAAERFGKQQLCCHAHCIPPRVVVALSHSPRRINPIQLYFERCVVNFAPHCTRRAEENAAISTLPCRAAF